MLTNQASRYNLLSMKHIILVFALVLVGCGGKDGAPGGAGSAGPAGAAGATGAQGIQGIQGNPAIMYVVDVCGDAPNIIDEVVLIMDDGQVVRTAPYLQSTPNGTFHTNDGTYCQFVVHNGTVTW